MCWAKFVSHIIVGRGMADCRFHPYQLIHHWEISQNSHLTIAPHTHCRRRIGENFRWQLQRTPYYCLLEARLIAAANVQFIVENRIHHLNDVLHFFFSSNNFR